MSPPLILIVDSQRLLADALGRALAATGEFDICEDRPEWGAQALQILGSDHPDVLIVEYQLRDMFAPALIRSAISSDPDMKAIQLSWLYGRRQVEEALKAGAVGALPKSVDVDVVVSGIQQALDGVRPIFSEQIAQILDNIDQRGDYVRDKEKRLAELTPRQLEILRLLGAGLRVPEVAERLYLAESTVRRHIHNLLATLGVDTQVQALSLAREHGYLT